MVLCVVAETVGIPQKNATFHSAEIMAYDATDIVSFFALMI